MPTSNKGWLALQASVAALVIAAGVLVSKGQLPSPEQASCINHGGLTFVGLAQDTSGMRASGDTLFYVRSDTNIVRGIDSTGALTIHIDSGQTVQLAAFCRDTTLLRHIVLR